jgi:hypothetical protein
MSRRLQARAKRNAIVHAASVAPCSMVVTRSFLRPPSRVHVRRRWGGLIARLRPTRHRGAVVVGAGVWRAVPCGRSGH